MSYDLAIMALDGLAKSPVELRVEPGQVVIEGSPASFKELARLFLLLGGGHMADDFELQPGVHVSGNSPRLRVSVSTE